MGVTASISVYIIDQTGYVPKDWGLVIIFPIYKKGSKNGPSNYRPINLLSVISKFTC